MSLSDLPDDIRQQTIRLPYRVGLFISNSDKSGGSDSDAAEMAALSNVVTYYVEDYCKSPFAQSVMLETLRYQSEWPSWNSDSVIDDCKKVFDALTDQLEMKDIVAFKNNLLEIAIAVAMAYREFNESDPWIEKFKIYLSVLVERIKAALKGEPPQSFDQMLNISRDEKAAINQLANALGIEHKVG